MEHGNSVYFQHIKSLSDRIVAAQKPIRILDAVSWDDETRQRFLAQKGSRLPEIDADYYARLRPLGFDPVEKRREFHDIERDLTRHLGQLNPLSVMMRRICREYQTVVRMLESRGTDAFADLSQELYGSASDVFHAGDPTLADLGNSMEETLANLTRLEILQDEPKTIRASEAVAILNDRLQARFPDAGVRVMVSDGIIADAAAGTDYIKIREDALFNARDIRILEVHEGWVHLGTTLNGTAQPYCSFLSKGPPSTTTTQEGLATLMEILTFSSTPSRLQRLINRVRAVTIAEQGADFLEVVRFFMDKNASLEESYSLATRVFRGSTPSGLPFTKDITYIKGFVLGYNFIRLAVSLGKPQRLPILFCGKTMIDDMKVLADLVEEGVIAPPKYLPPQFADLMGLTAWFSFSRFMTSLNFRQLEMDYANVL